MKEFGMEPATHRNSGAVPKVNCNDKEIQYIEVKPFDEAIYCISY